MRRFFFSLRSLLTLEIVSTVLYIGVLVLSTHGSEVMAGTLVFFMEPSSTRVNVSSE